MQNDKKEQLQQLVNNTRGDRQNWEDSKISNFYEDTNTISREILMLREMEKFLHTDLGLDIVEGSRSRSDAIFYRLTEDRIKSTLLRIELEQGIYQDFWQNSIADVRSKWPYGITILSRKLHKEYDVFLKYNNNNSSFFALDIRWVLENYERFNEITQEDAVSKNMITNKTKIGISWNIIDEAVKNGFALLDSWANLQHFLIELAIRYERD